MYFFFVFDTTRYVAYRKDAFNESTMITFRILFCVDTPTYVALQEKY